MRSLYISLIISMLAGRLVWGLVSAIVYALMGSGFTWKLFFMGGFVNAIPGIVIQLILIPVLVNRLYAAGVVKPAYEGNNDLFSDRRQKIQGKIGEIHGTENTMQRAIQTGSG